MRPVPPRRPPHRRTPALSPTRHLGSVCPHSPPTALRCVTWPTSGHALPGDTERRTSPRNLWVWGVFFVGSLVFTRLDFCTSGNHEKVLIKTNNAAFSETWPPFSWQFRWTGAFMNKSPATAATETLTRHKKISWLAAGKLLAPHSVCLQAFHQIFPHYGHRLVGGKSAPSEWKNAGSGFCPDVLKLKIPAIDMLFVCFFYRGHLVISSLFILLLCVQHSSENGGVNMLEDGLPDFYTKRVLPDR